MILARARHVHAAAFDEIDAAVRSLLNEAKLRHTVLFNAHVAPALVPPDAIVFNLENIGLQISPLAFPRNTIWDFSQRNVDGWRAARPDGPPVHHVPIGHHPSMERFGLRRWAERDIDIVFTGAVNERRGVILDRLRVLGLRVETVSAPYGQQRDAVLSRARLAIAPVYYPNGLFSTLRAAHCVANRLVLVAEEAFEVPAWMYPAPCRYDCLVMQVASLLAGGERAVSAAAEEAYRRFYASPLRLPDQYSD